ncbi:MAG: DUF364 domain-containing protein [Arenicellales bacterium]|jgi:uncharacterized protein (DUF4213/DUF364 family)|nr:DUF364 domain-containing protein [Arenicellales bacterium]MDP6790631.1 DUF364 domain-containing protein [Arenicellales bacterium]MDP6919191.1 DUF364 domain-containing protein [Arenicellales bacterium]|tara:strand:- start:2238 stop:3068 length:831 start_codon:yes stop_codon:yes gene_type:complete
MTVLSDLVDLILAIGNGRELPPVAAMYKPPPARPPERPKKFGVIVLDDDSCGFFYAGLDNTLSQLAACDPHQFTGAAPLDLVRNCLESDPLAKAVGLGVLNALSQHLLSVSGFRLDRTGDPMGHLDLAGAQHVGMVGFFPPLVAALADHPASLTIIEKDPQFQDWPGRFLVTEETRRIQDCDRVLITGSTLMNDTLDDVLSHCNPASQIALVGPTASCLPDPIFERGIDVVGSATVSDLPLLVDLLQTGEPWRAGTAKYCIARSQYPGIRQLMADS